jgi:hypothetical protein
MVYHLESWTWCSGPEETHSGGRGHTAPSQINQLKKAQQREEVPIDGVVLSSKDLQVPLRTRVEKARVCKPDPKHIPFYSQYYPQQRQTALKQAAHCVIALPPMASSDQQ